MTVITKNLMECYRIVLQLVYLSGRWYIGCSIRMQLGFIYVIHSGKEVRA
jgi:hypothetical protein